MLILQVKNENVYLRFNLVGLYPIFADVLFQGLDKEWWVQIIISSIFQTIKHLVQINVLEFFASFDQINEYSLALFQLIFFKNTRCLHSLHEFFAKCLWWQTKSLLKMYQLCFLGFFILICSEVTGYFLYFLWSNLNLQVGQSLTELLLVDERV